MRVSLSCLCLLKTLLWLVSNARVMFCNAQASNLIPKYLIENFLFSNSLDELLIIFPSLQTFPIIPSWPLSLRLTRATSRTSPTRQQRLLSSSSWRRRSSKSASPSTMRSGRTATSRHQTKNWISRSARFSTISTCRKRSRRLTSRRCSSCFNSKAWKTK